MQRSIHAQLGGTVCAAALCVLIGCSEDSSSPAGSAGGFDVASIRACELLTPAEIEAATGLGVDPGTDIGLAGSAPMCSWAQTASEVDIVVTLIVSPGRYRNYDEFLDSTRDSAFGDVFGEADVEPVELASPASFGVWMPEAGTLQAYGDGFMVQVGTETASGRDRIEASKELAQAVAARLR